MLLLGTGLLNTLIQLRGAQMDFSTMMLGALTSAYYIGFFLGTYTAPPLIRTIGHIRAFAFFAASFACLVLLHALIVDAWVWMVLRLLTGAALVGLYTVIESWLNATAEPAARGGVFAAYMAVNLGSLALAQQMLYLHVSAPFVMFVLVTLFVCASTLPVLLTRMTQPALQPTPRLQLRRLFAAAPSAGVGALTSGLAMGAFWGLAPVYATAIGFSQGSAGTYMSIAILGGAVMQWPLGRISDRNDRRVTLAAVCAVAAVVALLTPLAAAVPWLACVGIAAFGGTAFAVYPIVVAHLLDYLPPEDLLPASSSVLLLNGIGSAIGPLVAGVAMALMGPSGLFGWFALSMGFMAFYAAYRYRIFKREQIAELNFQPMMHTSPSALEMVPGIEADAVTTHEQSVHMP